MAKITAYTAYVNENFGLNLATFVGWQSPSYSGQVASSLQSTNPIANWGVNTITYTGTNFQYTLDPSTEIYLTSGTLDGVKNYLNYTGELQYQVTEINHDIATYLAINADWNATGASASLSALSTYFQSGNDVFNGSSFDDTFYGYAGNDVLYGNAGADWLYGGDGNDVINGGLGADGMVGGSGNDTFIVDNANDYVSESAGQGTDTVKSSINYTLGANLEKLILTGSAALHGAGNAMNNILIGNSAANVLQGEGGNDTLNGGAGNDTLNGGAGNDVVLGGRGKDTLTGGTGADHFVFKTVSDTAAGSRRDVITDFSHGQHDKIDLHAIDAKAGSGTANDAFQFITGSSFTAAGQVYFANGILYGNTDSNTGTAEFSIALPHVTHLIATDFIL